MAHRFSIRKALSFALIEYKKWLLHTHMLILAILIVFIYNYAVAPLLNNAARMGAPLNALEPVVALANSGQILLILPLAFLALIADYPKKGADTFFALCRVGRVNWLAGQVALLFLMAVTFLSAIVAGCMLSVSGHCFWGGEWSDVATKFVSVFPEEYNSFAVQLLPENLYNQFCVRDAAFLSFALVFAHLFLLGLILLVFTLLKLKRAGFLVCGGLVSLAAALMSVHAPLQWLLPMAHSVLWIHYTEYFREPVFPVWASGAYFAAWIVILLAAGGHLVRRFDL